MRFRSFQLRNPRLCPREKVKLHGRHVVKVTFINVLASLTANCVDVQFSLFRVYLVGKKRLLIVSFSAFLSVLALEPEDHSPRQQSSFPDD